MPASIYSVPKLDRSRVIAFVLSLALVALILLMLIDMGLIDLDAGHPNRPLVSVQIQQQVQGDHRPSHAAAAKAQKAPLQPQQLNQPIPPRPLPTPSPAPAFIPMSSSDFASSDISKMGHAAQGNDADGQDDSKTYGPGEGPGGVHLYMGNWLHGVPPSNAEIAPYLPPDVPDGAEGAIMCRVAEHNHVEDCQDLDDSIPGAGVARASRRASWQYLIDPPTRNGKPMIGAWVKITLTIKARRSTADPPGAEP